MTNSIKGLLKLHGIFDVQPRSKDFEAKFADVKTAYGEPLPPAARQEILRISERLALVEEQIAQVEAERDAFVLSGKTISMVDAPEGSQARAAAKIAALTRLKRSGELSAVWVPDEEQEAVRDLTRAREDMKAIELKARQRLGAFCCATGGCTGKASAAERSSTFAGWRSSGSRTRRSRWCSRNTPIR